MTTATRPVAPFRWKPRLPGDKSITHRCWLIGALAGGTTRVAGANRGADCAATLRAVSALGVRVSSEGPVVVVEGSGGRLGAPAGPLDLGNSGTGLRLLLGVLAGQEIPVTLAGDASLNRRPVERVLIPLRTMGATAEAPGDHPPVTIRGGPLRGIRYALPVASAQVKSAVLLAGIQAEGSTEVTGGRGTRDHTERMLRDFGVGVETGEDRVAVTGPCRLRACRVDVPGDPSAAAFYCLAAGIVPGSQVMLEGVSLNPTRTSGFEEFRRMGLSVEEIPELGDSAEPRGSLHIRGAGLRGIGIGPGAVPGLIDELPALAVAAAFAEGATTVTGAAELRLKESDRLRAVGLGLRAIGARVEVRDDGWSIEGSGGAPLPGGEVQSHGDHRIAMAFLVAGLACRRGVRILDDPMIETSDPFFTKNLNQVLES